MEVVSSKEKTIHTKELGKMVRCMAQAKANGKTIKEN
jgi:hypothetical protein